MGNNSSIQNAVPITSQSAPPDLKSQIQSNLNLIENSLSNFETQLISTKNLISFKHTTLKSKLINKFTYTDFQIDIQRKHNELRKKILKARRFSVINAGHKQIRYLIYNFYSNTKGLKETFIDGYYFKKDFNLQNKIKYLHLHDSFEELVTDAIDDNCYNYIIMPITREKIFYCMAIFEKKSYMKITDKAGFELHRTRINSEYYYRHFMIYGIKLNHYGNIAN